MVIALKVYMILPCLLLQKPSRESKARDHVKKLEERIKTWQEGRLYDILHEGWIIQRRLKTSKSRSAEDTARSFAKLIIQGKINAALKLLSSESENGVHKIDDVLKQLQDKHPKPSPVTQNTLLFGPINKVLPSYFDNIDESIAS